MCWQLSVLPALEPPFLVTHDIRAAAIFYGGVLFETRSRRPKSLDWSPSVPVAADSWVGVAIARRVGWLRRTYEWTLFAVSADPNARVEPGPVHSPGYPDYPAGVILSLEGAK